jgi:hypothetical protein
MVAAVADTVAAATGAIKPKNKMRPSMQSAICSSGPGGRGCFRERFFLPAETKRVDKRLSNAARNSLHSRRGAG